MTTTRYVWIDWLRNLSMLLIIWGHFFPYAFTPFVYAFNVPVFFFTSGLLAHRRSSWKDFLKADGKALVVPYLIICLIKAAAYILKHLDGGAENSLIGIVGGFHTFHEAPGAKLLWFVYTLFVIRILQQAGVFSKGPLANALLAVASMAGGYFYASSPLAEMKWAVGNTLLAIPFYVIGIEMAKAVSLKDIGSKLSTRRPLLVVIAIGSGVLVYWLSTFNGEAYMYMGSYGNNIALFYLAALIGIVGMMALSLALNHIDLKANRILSVGGLVMLGFQYDLIHPLRKVVVLVSDGNDLMHAFATFVAAAVILLAFIPIVWIAQRYLPFLTGFRRYKGPTPALPGGGGSPNLKRTPAGVLLIF